MKNTLLLTLALIAFGVQANDATTQCREWAEQDGIAAEQMNAYMEECKLNMGEYNEEIEVANNEADPSYEASEQANDGYETEQPQEDIVD